MKTNITIGDIFEKEDISKNEELNKTLSDIELKEFIKTFISHLRHYDKFSSQQIAELFGKKIPLKIILPVSIFNNEELGSLETIVKYLKEDLNLRYHEIALLLNRDDRTIWTTYSVANKKRKEKLLVEESKFFIPILIFKDRKFSVLEALVSYLKDKFNLRYSEIAVLLARDERNIWTVYQRSKKK